MWPDFLDILVLDLSAAMFFTPDVTDAIDVLLTRNFAATEVEHPVRVPRQFGFGSPVGGSTGSGQPSRPGTRGTSPVGTRGSAMERQLAEEKARAAVAVAEAMNLRAQLQAMSAGGVGGHGLQPTPAPPLPLL